MEQIKGTEKLYDIDAYATRFDAIVMQTETWQDGVKLILDKTLFFPEEAGQNCDTGVIFFKGQEYEVTYVSLEKKEGIEVISHFIKNVGDIFQIGDVVCGQICWKDRYDKMQNHSGEHLLSGIIHQNFGYDNVGFHLNDELFTMDFNGVLSMEQLYFLEEKANEVVMENVDIYGEYVPDEELSELSYRSKKEIEGAVRIVTIEGYDKCACCAPHVKTSIEIGVIKIIKAENWKGGMRLTVLCGNRAYKDYAKKHKIVQTISRNLSASEEKIVEMMENLKKDLGEAEYRVILAESCMITEKLLCKPIQFFEILSQKAVIKAMDDAIKQRKEELFAVFVGDDEKGYRYVLGGLEQDIAEKNLELREKFGAKGGGRGSMLQGMVQGKKSEIEKIFM